MSSGLVVLQNLDGKLLKASLVALSAARALQSAWGVSELHAICLGPAAAKAAEEALQYGFGKVLWSEDASLEKYRAVAFAAHVVEAAKQTASDLIISAATSIGKDMMPRVAATIDAAQASEILAVNSDGTLKRPLFAGNVLADVELQTLKRCITVRGTAFPPAEKTSATGTLIPLGSVTFVDAQAGEVVSYELSASDRPELGDASVVVSGGRALASSENFQKYIFPLADAFGAAVGASRAAVDSGYAPNDWQVGQTGKVVAPQLYVAVGISGAIQHLAGMKDSKFIVAINKDSEAPIFEVADYGLVGDLFALVPQLTEAVKKAKAG